MRRSHGGASVFDISCLSRVEGPSLDPQKKWYIYRKRLSAHSLPNLRISPIAYRRYFRTKFKVLQRGNSGAPNREAYSGLQELHPISEKPVRAFHVWSFCVGILRQREIPPDGLPKSPAFTSVARLVNCIDLEPQEAKISILARNLSKTRSAQLSTELAEKKILLSPLSLMQARIADLESEIEGMVTSCIPDHSSSPCKISFSWQ